MRESLHVKGYLSLLHQLLKSMVIYHPSHSLSFNEKKPSLSPVPGNEGFLLSLKENPE
jgi:hypothetical protein